MYIKITFTHKCDTCMFQAVSFMVLVQKQHEKHSTFIAETTQSIQEKEKQVRVHSKDYLNHALVQG